MQLAKNALAGPIRKTIFVSQLQKGIYLLSVKSDFLLSKIENYVVYLLFVFANLHPKRPLITK